jgi:hypothetical protein
VVQWYRLSNGLDGGPAYRRGHAPVRMPEVQLGAGAGLIRPSRLLLLYSVEHSDRGPERSVQFEEFFPLPGAESSA